jgi:hypothetical protein
MGLKHPIFTWFWVNFPIKINGGQIGGPKYLNYFYYLRYFDPPYYGQGPLMFKTTIHGFETPKFYMVLG